MPNFFHPNKTALSNSKFQTADGMQRFVLRNQVHLRLITSRKFLKNLFNVCLGVCIIRFNLIEIFGLLSHGVLNFQVLMIVDEGYDVSSTSNRFHFDRTEKIRVYEMKNLIEA